MNKLQHKSVIEEVFPIYIERFFSKSESALEFWNKINSINHCYVFGGFIVDFLNKKTKHRDIDIVIDTLSSESILLIKKYDGKKNNFGGYKINIDGIIIDLWAIEDTWAIKKMNYINFDLFSILPSTSFFNSTAIIYSLREQQLTFKNKFLQFIDENILDILFEDNPLPELCIVKSYQYYCQKINLSDKLKKYIIRMFPHVCHRFDNVQKRHYGEIIYTIEELKCYYEKIKAEIVNDKNIPTMKFQAEQFLLFNYC